MPIPSPKGKEAQDKFVARCMESLKDEKKDQKQKLAICYSTWKRAKQNAKGAEEDINWDDYANEPFIIVP